MCHLLDEYTEVIEVGVKTEKSLYPLLLPNSLMYVQDSFTRSLPLVQNSSIVPRVNIFKVRTINSSLLFM